MKRPNRLHSQPEIPMFTKMENRPRSRDEYHSSRWTKRSRVFRQAHPLCERCRKKGIVRASEVTDHVIPVEVYGDFWDESNWQALCTPCNLTKGAEDRKLIQNKRNEKR